jgi:hypothetical protein
MCDTAQRLVALLRLLEREPAPFGVLGDDAVLDAWFGSDSTFGPPLHEQPLAAPALGRERVRRSAAAADLAVAARPGRWATRSSASYTSPA